MADVKKKKLSKITKGLVALLLIGLGVVFLSKLNLSKKSPVKWILYSSHNGFIPKKNSKSKSEILLYQDITVENWYYLHRGMVVDFSVSAKTEPDKRDLLAQRKNEHDSEIKDRMRSVVGALRPEDIKDPHLKVAKSEIKNELQQIVGSGLIKEVLFPEWNCTLLGQSGVATNKKATDPILLFYARQTPEKLHRAGQKIPSTSQL